MKTLRRLFVALFCLVGFHLHAGNLKVNLAPSAAASAGAQWRVDGGSWRNSGSTASGLSNTTHTVDFKTVSGWIAPASTAVAISGGTTTITGTYVHAAGLKITLAPTTGQWRIDSGAWRASGATVTGLTPGNHTIDYAAVSGFASPATETVALIPGQTTTLTRGYTQLAQLTVTLSPAGAQWRVDGGSWRASGTTVAGLVPGAHTIDYASVPGYANPAPETLTLTAGQAASLTRNYIQLAQVTVTLSPVAAQWNVDGGAWQTSGATVANLGAGAHTINYSAVSGYLAPAPETVMIATGQLLALNRSYLQLAQLTLSLTPASAQWRLDGGAWQASGASLSNLSLGNHLVEYASFPDHLAPPPENVALVSGANNLVRSYTPVASFTVSLNPVGAQWRLDGGDWQSSGTTLYGLSLGNHTVEFSSYIGYLTPAAETVTLVSGTNPTLTRSYTQLASFGVTLNPIGAQWRLDGGDWQSSGTTLYGLSLGNHTVEFSSYIGYLTPAAETVTLVSGTNPTLTRSYTQLASFGVTLDPIGAQWRLDGGDWQSSGTTLSGLSLGNHTVEFSSYIGYLTPAAETVTLVSGTNPTLTRSYTQLASFGVTLNPIGAQWRLDGGDWQSSGTTLYGLTLGTHTVEFSAVYGYLTPNAITVNLVGGSNSIPTPTYVAVASFYVYYSQPPYGQWRIDGGVWKNSSDMLTDLPLGNHTIEFADVLGYITPAPVTVNLVRGYNSLSAPTYVQLASFYVYYSQLPYGQWRIDGGPWRNSSDMLNNLSLGAHLVEFADVPGYITPASRTVTLGSGYNSLSAPTYVQLASFYVYYSQLPYGQWRIDGGPWRNSSDMLNNLSLGTHLIEFADVPGYITPASRTVTLGSGYNSLSAPAYVQLASFYVYYSQLPYGQWRIDGGPWRNSSDMLNNLSLGTHLVEFADVPGYITPASRTVTLGSGYNSVSAPTYVQLASFYVYYSQLPYGQWRIDGGPWRASSDMLNNLSLGTHLVEFADVPGYITPASQTVTLTSGYNSLTAPAYIELASFYVYYSQAPYGQWRMDGGPWRNSSDMLSSLSLGSHSIEFADVPGYNTPASVTINLVSGYNSLSAPAYTPLAFAPGN